MNHRDAEITEVVVVVQAAYYDRFDDAINALKAHGMDVLSTDRDDCVINGTIETYKIPELEKHDCVNYVRSVLTYIADFPVGDSRNQDDTPDDQDEAEAV